MPSSFFIKVEELKTSLSSLFFFFFSFQCLILVRTNLFQGHSPFWMQAGAIDLFTKEDTVQVSLFYVLGEDKDIESDGTEEKIASFDVLELEKLATGTETRRW